MDNVGLDAGSDIRRVLVIAYYFPPLGLSGVQRTLKFVKYLPYYGWEPIVLTSKPTSYYAFDETLGGEIHETKIYRASEPGFGIFRKKKVKTIQFPSYFKQKIGRAMLQTIYQPDSKVRWKKNALELGEEILRKYKINAIFATAPPYTDFLVAKELSIRFNKPFVIDYRDSWVDNPFNFYPTPFHKSYSIGLESEVLKRSRRIIVTSRYAKEQLIKRYRFLSHDDVVIIPHGYDPEDFEILSETKPDPEKFTITHSGAFQDDRTPKYFLKALNEFFRKNPQAKSRVQVRFVGLIRPGHQKMIKKMNLADNIQNIGYVDHLKSVEYLLESDVLWLMLNDTVRTPGKLYEYFGAGKPLLLTTPDGMMRRLALDSKAAITCDPDDIGHIAISIENLYKQWERNALPKPDKDYVQGFDRKKLTGELARVLSLIAEF